MAQITITIPDSITPRVINGFASYYGYSPTLDDGTPNPQTKAQFAKAKLIELIKNAVRETEMQNAKNTAATAAAADVDSQITMT